MRCLVIGGCGFIGKRIIKGLVADGYVVRVFDRPSNIENFDLKENVELFSGDFINEEDVNNAIAGCDFIYHLISTTVPQTSNENPIYDVETNLLGTIKMLSLAVKHGVKKVLFSSSGGTVYGVPVYAPIDEKHPTDPICSYGVTKLAIEKYLHLYYVIYGLDYCVLRVSNVYGEGQTIKPSQGVIGVFIEKAMKGKIIEVWGDGSVVRDYIHIADVASAFIKATTYDGKSKVFNISSGEGKSINEILTVLQNKIGHELELKYMEGRPVDVPVNVLTNALAIKELGWSVKESLDSGIEKTLIFNRHLSF